MPGFVLLKLCYLYMILISLKTIYDLFQLYISWHQNKVSWYIIENGHSFEWNEDRVTVFLKWTDFSNIFWFVRNPFSSSSIHFAQIWSKKSKIKKAIVILFVNVTTFYSNIFWLVRNPFWSSLIHFGQIWSKKIKNKTAIFILSVNVTTFYSNIFRLVRKSNLIKFDQVWSSLIKFDQVWSSLIKSDQVWSILDRSSMI